MLPTPSQPPAGDGLETSLTRFAEVRAVPPAWLWPNWLPLGKVAILDGDPGLGKSTLLFDLAAHVSSTGIMPDGSAGATGGVLILNAEDDPEDTIRPRLAGAGANLERVFHLGKSDAGRRPVRLPDDVPLLGRLIGAHGASLLIVDPLLAYLPEVDVNRAQHVCQVLQRLSSMAREQRCTVVCVRHLNKGASAKAVYRGTGSIWRDRPCPHGPCGCPGPRMTANASWRSRSPIWRLGR